MQQYKGSCHCGAVAYEVELSLDEVMSCNCSICRRRGHLLAFTPAENFRLLQGETELSDYQFGRKTVHHLFCKRCGINAFGRGRMPDGKEMVAINVGCLDGVDLKQLSVKEFDGASM